MRRVRAEVRQRAAEVRRRAGWAAYRALRRLARRFGYHLLRATYYSPVADTGRLPAETWTEPSPMPGISLDLDAQLRWVAGHVTALPPVAGFDPDNQFYGVLDAAVLHAMIRHERPAQVLEIGAGHSTLVIADALGPEARHRVVDPNPSPVLAPLEGRIELRRSGATDVAIEEFAALEPGDVLFIDTSHAVRPGGDVVYLLLEALPALRPGVLVHVHDVYRPYEYPRALADDWGLHWQEHHLLQALLAFSDRFEVVLAVHALWRTHAAELEALVPGAGRGAVPSGFWLRA